MKNYLPVALINAGLFSCNRCDDTTPPTEQETITYRDADNCLLFTKK